MRVNLEKKTKKNGDSSGILAGLISALILTVMFLGIQYEDKIENYLIQKKEIVEVTLQWDANTESDLAGYKVYHDIDSGTPYDNVIEVPLTELEDVDNPEYIVSGINDDENHFFVVTAYDNQDPPLESDYSNEVSLESVIIPPVISLADTTLSWNNNTEPDLDGYKVYYVNGTGEPYNGTSPLINEVIIDNGDPETFYAGNWETSAGLDPYGSNSLYADDNSSIYTYSKQLGGDITISLYWTTHETRCENTIIEIYNDGFLIQSLTVNQLQNYAQWNIITTQSLWGLVEVKIVSQEGCSTCADAVKFEIPYNSPITVFLNDLSDINNPEYTLTLNECLDYEYVVTAFDSEKLESSYSNSVSSEESCPPNPPVNVQIIISN